MKIPKPFLPVRAESQDLCHDVHVLGRDYTFGPDGWIQSIRSEGHELLAGPIRFIVKEDGEDAVWDEQYSENESESFIQSRSDEKICICGARQSKRFIVDICNTVHYDGSIDMDLKLMTRGRTVAQVFGVADTKPTQFKLDQMWMEIPLKAEFCSLYHMCPNSDFTLPDGTVQKMTSTSMSGRLPESNVGMPFKALLWIGNEERGLGWYAESDKNWQSTNPDTAIEVVRDGAEVIHRIRLLDHHPASWKGDYEEGLFIYYPISFHFGLMATPVKPFPVNPYPNNTLHLDCGIKIKGNYRDFLDAENRFDRLKEKGVTTLILHEKWNKSQNWFELSEYTKAQLCYIVDECHKRGIKVLPYFGYEMSTMSPAWNMLSDKVLAKREAQTPYGGWWRVPFQRDYTVCYNSEYANYMAEGIARIMDTCHIDGIYLDGTAYPQCCYNTEHGCGWYDEEGQLHGTYGIHGIQKLFRTLYEVVTSRGGELNVHSYGCVNFTALPYIHTSWYGENLQMDMMKGNTEDVDLNYFRAEYLGRNMGVPVEFIAYENRPRWNFENALSCSILHGILPRPNDINYPLDLMSKVWSIFGQFPIDRSEWMPYWKNAVTSTHEKILVSYYRYRMLNGKYQLLAFAVNIGVEPVEQVEIGFCEPVTHIRDLMSQENTGFAFSVEGYGCRILLVE